MFVSSCSFQTGEIVRADAFIAYQITEQRYCINIHDQSVRDYFDQLLYTYLPYFQQDKFAHKSNLEFTLYYHFVLQ